MNNLEEKLDSIIDRLKDQRGQDQLNKEYENAIQYKTLMTKYDILRAFGISLNTWNELGEAIKSPKTTEEEIQKITYIRDKVDSFEKNMKIINDKVIKSNGKISKSTMSYLLKEKEEEHHELVIINVNVKGEDFITLEKVKERDKK